jgi:hypothetical protein
VQLTPCLRVAMVAVPPFLATQAKKMFMACVRERSTRTDWARIARHWHGHRQACYLGMAALARAAAPVAAGSGPVHAAVFLANPLHSQQMTALLTEIKS